MFANAIEESYQESLTRKQARASKGNQKAYAEKGLYQRWIGETQKRYGTTGIPYQ